MQVAPSFATYSAISSDLAIQPDGGSAYPSDTDQLQDNASIFADSSANPTDATAPTAATAPPPTAGPSASPTEIAALELLLAEPANQEMVAQFGPPLRPLNTDTDVGQGILARFGPDLGARLGSTLRAPACRRIRRSATWTSCVPWARALKHSVQPALG